jgi:hypothetical protein
MRDGSQLAVVALCSSGAQRLMREEPKGRNMSWRHRAEMAMVKRHQHVGIETFSQSDD